MKIKYTWKLNTTRNAQTGCATLLIDIFFLFILCQRLYLIRQRLNLMNFVAPGSKTRKFLLWAYTQGTRCSFKPDFFYMHNTTLSFRILPDAHFKVNGFQKETIFNDVEGWVNGYSEIPAKSLILLLKIHKHTHTCKLVCFDKHTHINVSKPMW